MGRVHEFCQLQRLVHEKATRRHKLDHLRGIVRAIAREYELREGGEASEIEDRVRIARTHEFRIEPRLLVENTMVTCIVIDFCN